jgi:hypothetical protein
VHTAKKTMLYMAISLAFTAGGILVCYLLWHAVPVEGKTMNAVLLDRVFGSWQVGPFHLGAWLVILTLVSEGALLFVAAQTGFIDGPRVLANMAVDSWVPHRFAHLSERLVSKNGILIMGIASGLLIFYTKGQVSFLVVLYSINVFLTFSLTEMGMSRFWMTDGRSESHRWKRNLAVHATGLVLCLTILFVTTYEKFAEGGWLTLVVTVSFIVLCLLIQQHYGRVRAEIKKMDEILTTLPAEPKPAAIKSIDPAQPVAVVLVSGYGGLGIHSLLGVQRLFSASFKGVIFISVGVVDAGHFKGQAEVAELKESTEANLKRYVAFAQSLGLAADFRYRMGTDVLEQAEQLCGEITRDYPRAVFFLGKLIFAKERLFYRLLHNDTAFAIQRRLQFAGLQAVILPIRITMS